MLSLRQLRRSRGLTQLKLAERLGVTNYDVGNWEKKGIIPQEHLSKIASIFEMDPSDIISKDFMEWDLENQLAKLELAINKNTETLEALIEHIKQHFSKSNTKGASK